jgi:hypothetical protein
MCRLGNHKSACIFFFLSMMLMTKGKLGPAVRLKELLGTRLAAVKGATVCWPDATLHVVK